MIRWIRLNSTTWKEGRKMNGKFDSIFLSARRRLVRGVGSCLFLIVLVLFLASGCAPVGPNYVKPDMDTANQWNAALADGLVSAPPDPKTMAAWWKTLEDPVLSKIMGISLEGSLDLREARARVREARARRGINEAGLFPRIDTSGSFTKSRSSENAGSGTESKLYAAGFDAGWELDVFGGIRRSIEAADAELSAARENFYSVLVSLLGEIALNYIEVRTYQTRLQVAEANIGIQEETYELTKSRFEAGLVDELPVKQALYNLESTRARIPALRIGLQAAMYRLAVLAGDRPGALDPLLEKPQPVPVPPVTVAVGTPAETLRNRPDIKRAERLLAAQSARIGVAVSDLYPRFTLPGSIGLESISSTTLFNRGSHAWRIAPGVTWNVFDAGAIRNNIAAQTAIEEQYLAQYETAILTALEEVENAMVAYAEEQLRRERLVKAMEAARDAMRLSRDRFSAGLVDFSNVLIAQASLLNFEDQLAESDGAVTSDLVRLYKALGGGWQSFAPEASVELIAEENAPRSNQ